MILQIEQIRSGHCRAHLHLLTQNIPGEAHKGRGQRPLPAQLQRST
ncbi:hypothetical protein BZA02_10860 [Ruegeria sp. P4]|nr:hypothetical protein BZA02_10860 [Ruegeria sp. P4]